MRGVWLVAGLCLGALAADLPVVCVHGRHGTPRDCAAFGRVLHAVRPNQAFYALESLAQAAKRNLFDQVALVRDEIQSLVQRDQDVFRHGFHLVGHGQGALVARAVVQTTDGLGVKKLISLAGNQAGEFVSECFSSRQCC